MTKKEVRDVLMSLDTQDIVRIDPKKTPREPVFGVVCSINFKGDNTSITPTRGDEDLTFIVAEIQSIKVFDPHELVRMLEKMHRQKRMRVRSSPN